MYKFFEKVLTLKPQNSVLFNVLRIAIPTILVSLSSVIGLVAVAAYLFPTVYPQPFAHIFLVSPIVALIVTIILVIPLVWLNIKIFQELHDNRRKTDGAKTKLEQIIEQRARFVAYVSHEIRNPLNGIMGILGAMETSKFNKKQLDDVSSLRRSSNDLLVILNDILDLSKIDFGVLELNPQPDDLHNIIEDLREFWTARAHSHGLTLNLKISESYPRWVNIDGSRFRQIASNLISNAIKYSDQGSILINAEFDYKNHLAVFNVTDSGNGIPNSMFESVFDPYFQVPEKGSLSRKMGTGLGLPIARQLAKQMGGNCWLVSSSKKGSHFAFSMKVDELDSPLEVLNQVKIPKGLLKNRTALVVDDLATNRFVAEALLGKLGIDTKAVENGTRAIEELLSTTYDIVLLDDELGDMQSKDVYFATHSFQKNTKYIAYTGSILSEDVKRFKAMGLDGFIGKPISLESLRSEIERVLMPT